MLTFSETKTKVYMKKSLFRLTDLLELCLAYSFCFSLNLLMDYAKTLDLDAYILKAFLKNFIDYQPLIVSLFTSIVIAFHYQMLERKKAEIFCRILVGGTVFNIAIRYMLDCISVLIFVYLATVYKGNIIKNLIMDCQSYTKYRPNETTGGIFVSWRRKEELPTGA